MWLHARHCFGGAACDRDVGVSVVWTPSLPIFVSPCIRPWKARVTRRTSPANAKLEASAAACHRPCASIARPQAKMPPPVRTPGPLAFRRTRGTWTPSGSASGDGPLPHEHEGRNVTRYRVEFDGVILGDNGEPITDRDVVQSVVDLVLLELSKLAATGPRVVAQPDRGGITVSVDVEESEMFMASVAGFTQIRTAVHAADLGTPGWKVEWFRTTTIRPERTRPEAVAT